MKTITVREANSRIARYRGDLGLVIEEVIVPTPEPKGWSDREVLIPCGFTGSLYFQTEGVNVSIGSSFRKGHKKDEEGKPYLDGLILEAVMERGMVFAQNVSHSFFDIIVRGCEEIGTGIKLQDCQSLALCATLTNIGIQDPYLTGQGYGIIAQDCEACIISDVQVSGARYGVSLTGSSEAMQIVNVFGHVLVAHVDFHSGEHLRPIVAGVASVKDGNETFGGGSVDGQFYGVEELRRVEKVLSIS
jgi:hypothetical protein